MKNNICVLFIFFGISTMAQNSRTSKGDVIGEVIVRTIAAAANGFPKAELSISSVTASSVEAVEPKEEHFEVYCSDTVFYSATLADYGFKTIFKIHKELIVNNYALELKNKYSEIYVVSEYMDLSGNWIEVYYEAEKKDLKYESLLFYN
jgi:hypothetical protein